MGFLDSFPEPDEPPDRPRGPLKGWRVLLGVGLAGIAQLAVLLLVRRHTAEPDWPGYALKLQIVLFAVCVAAAALLLRWVDRGVGAGLLIGWAIGILISGPVLGLASVAQGCRQLFGSMFSG